MKINKAVISLELSIIVQPIAVFVEFMVVYLEIWALIII